MARHKNVNWELTDCPVNWDSVKTAVLMDIRDELQALNRTLGCYRVTQMCDDVGRIQRRLAKHMPLPKGRHK